MSALDAITQAQKIAFAPMLFQAVVVMLRHGVLAYIDRTGDQGTTLQEIENHTRLSYYAVRLLLDVGVSGEVIAYDGQCYRLSKIGYFLLHDQMTQVNLNFTQDVCYQGLFYLGNAFVEEKPSGLKVFGNWERIYPALSQLPEAVQKSWFEFDHFYSDAAYDKALPYVFAQKPRLVYDVGGNTGKFALKCCRYDADVHVAIIDLAQQIDLAMENVAQQGLSGRITGHAADLLTDVPLPKDADIWWMSQFLDCFSKEQIIAILEKVYQSMKPESRLYILEIFPDRQPFAAGEFSLNMSSLYFTCMANGNSRFYDSTVFIQCVEQAGFEVENQIDGLGIGHSLLICWKNPV